MRWLRLWSARAGRWVGGCVAVCGVRGDPWAGVLFSLLIASRGGVTLTTFPAATCCLKTSYGRVTVAGCAGARRTLVMKMFASRRMLRVIQKRVERNGLC